VGDFCAFFGAVVVLASTSGTLQQQRLTGVKIMKRTMVLSAMTAVGLLCAAGQAQVVISQVYGGGGNGGSTYKNDFIQLKNIGSSPVTLVNHSVQYASAAGTTWQVTNLPASVTLNPGQYFLIQEAQGAGGTDNLPTPDAIGTIQMSASNGKVALVNSTTALTGAGLPNAAIVDFVGFGSANNFEGSGAAPALTNSTAAYRMDNGCKETNDNAADFTSTGPTPFNSGSTIPCGATFPDVALQLSNSGCAPAVNSTYTVTAQVSNVATATAADTTVTLVLPPSLTYVSNTGGGVYNAGTRTLTWNAGSVAAGGATSVDVVTTVNAAVGLTVTGSVSTSTANDPTGNNAAANYNETPVGGTPAGVILVASSSDPLIATDIGGGMQLSAINRVFTSADGNWVIFRGSRVTLDTNTDGLIVVGHHVGSAWQWSVVAQEGVTAPLASQPGSKIDTNSFNSIQGINNNGQYVWSGRLRDTMGTTGTGQNTDDVLNWVVVKGSVAGGITSVIKGGDTNHAGNVGADSAIAPELAGRTYIVLSSSTIQNDGTVSFAATLSGTSATAAAFLTDDGATLLAQKGVFVPQNGDGSAMNILDDDQSSDGRGLMVSADGASWIGTGRVGTPGSSTNGTADDVVVVNGFQAVREGSPVGSFTDAAGWATFGSQQVPWVQMLPDASWYVHGYNPAGGFNQGLDWVMRNGNLLAQTGAPIISSTTESWNDGVLQRTFFAATGSGNDYVVGGLTSRGLAANGTDTATDGVVVYKGATILAREGMPVEVAAGDVRELNLINDNRSFIAGGTLYMTATLRTANNTCTQGFAGLPQVIVALPLPAAPTCQADMGATGGVPGSDGLLNNNDFVVFIDYFFQHNPLADVGSTGGVHGSDGAFDNNDFVVFIDLFFTGC